jgi:pyridoxine kinase
MAKVLCLSSQVVWGPVGNTAAVPALQAEGHEVLQVPTIVLSHHPGHGPPSTQPIAAETFHALIASVARKGALADCAAVMTGYFADPAQIAQAAELVRLLRAANPKLIVLVDPVMGDHGALYVAEAVANAIRDLLLPLATITTPNCFELSWLTGESVTTSAQAAAAAVKLEVPEILVTSIPLSGQQLGTLLLQHHTQHLIPSQRRAHVPHGTGDFLAACYLAHRLTHAAEHAFATAMARLHQVISLSGESKVLHIT